MDKLTDLIEKNLIKSIEQSNQAVNKSMKTTSEPGPIAYGVTYVIFSLLIAWWATWIIPHFTDKQFGFWQLAIALFLAYVFVIPRKFGSIIFCIASAATIYIWFFI